MKIKSQGINELMAKQTNDGTLTSRANLVKNEINQEIKDKFLKPDFSKEISKFFNLKLSPFQADLLTKLAHNKHSSKQQVIIEAIYSMLEVENLLTDIKEL